MRGVRSKRPPPGRASAPRSTRAAPGQRRPPMSGLEAQRPTAPRARWTVWLGVAALMALLTFTVVALGVGHGGEAPGAVRRLDEALLRWTDARATPALDKVALAVTQLGSWIVVATMALLASAILWTQGHRRAVALLWLGLIGVLALSEGLKPSFARPRPEVFAWRTPEPRGYAFPSGHTLNATLAYTLFAYVVSRLGPSGRLRAAAGVSAALIVLLVGASRVYLGVHYPSDVVAGVLVGFAWAMACVAIVRLPQRRRYRRRPPGADG